MSASRYLVRPISLTSHLPMGDMNKVLQYTHTSLMDHAVSDDLTTPPSMGVEAVIDVVKSVGDFEENFRSKEFQSRLVKAKEISEELGVEGKFKSTSQKEMYDYEGNDDFLLNLMNDSGLGFLPNS
ncbi:hypothetical protein J6590_072996 [Homalodisca vitripennis]|nr:hypothetical protein J6590_072996 [Homalodisca vitripennis]